MNITTTIIGAGIGGITGFTIACARCIDQPEYLNRYSMKYTIIGAISGAVTGFCSYKLGHYTVNYVVKYCDGRITSYIQSRANKKN